MKKFNEEDFEVLKGPLQSFRQSPDSLSGAFILGIFIQILLIYFEHKDSLLTKFPNAKLISSIHLWITGVLILLSIIFAIPAVYNRGQKIQYLLSILVLQNVGAVSLAISGLFLLGENSNVTIVALLSFSYIIVMAGVLIFLATSVRLYILLKKGAFREGTARDNLRSNIENIIKSHFAGILIACIGLGYIIQFLLKTVISFDSEDMLMIFLAFLIYFMTMFVLPEQLVILYCKFRFKSFNFDPDGNLYPASSCKGDNKKNDNKKTTARV